MKKFIPDFLFLINGLASQEIAKPKFMFNNIFATKCLNGPPRFNRKYFP